MKPDFHMIGVIIRNTATKEIRRKSFWIILVLTAIVITAINGLSDTIRASINGAQVEGMDGMRHYAAFRFIAFWNSVLAIMLAVDAIRSDFESGMINTILSRPLSRLDYFLGRFLGVYLVVIFYYLISFLLTVLYPGAPGKGWEDGLHLAGALGIDSLEAVVFILWALLISNFFPRLSAFISTVIFLMIVTASNLYFLKEGSLPEIPENVFGFVGYVIYMATPRTGFISEVSSVLIGREGTLMILSDQWSHFVISTVILGAVNFWVFFKRDCTVR